MSIEDYDFKPARILDPIYADRRGGHRVNMERELEKIRKERKDRTRTAPCWDCSRFENCGKTAEMCKLYRRTNAPVKE